MLKRLIVLLLLLLLPNAINAQRIGEKTNLLYWTTTSPNIGIEIAWHKKWTVDLFTGYNPWEFSDDASLRHWLVKVEPRWWVCQPFGGHFFGLHGIYAKYNVGNIPFIKKLEEYTLRGDAYGAGVSYGYHFVLGGRWGLELTAGFGFLQFDYEKAICSDCKDIIGRYKRTYIGPTQLGVTLIFMLR